MHKLVLSALVLISFSTSNLLAQLDFNPSNHVKHALLDSMHHRIEAGDFERITSVIVAKDGKTIFEQYYNGHNENSLHNTRSVTKTMATLLTGIAIEQGYIESEQDKILNYLTPKKPIQNPDPRKEAITIEDLLSMSSCLECDDFNQFSRGHEERMYIVEDWTQFLLDLPIHSYPFGPKPDETKYGRVARYCTAGAACMADVVQQAMGTRSDSLLIQNVLRPLGIQHYKLHYTPMNVLNTAGGSEYRSRDFLKIIQMCLNEGRWNGEQVISSDWLKKATRPKANPYGNVEYGYLLWLQRFGEEGKEQQAFYMSGNGGNKVMAFPDAGITVVITSQNYNNRNGHVYSEELVGKYIVPALVD